MDKRRITTNAALLLLLTLIFGINQLPAMLAVVGGILSLEYLVIGLINWYYGGRPKH